MSINFCLKIYLKSTCNVHDTKLQVKLYYIESVYLFNLLHYLSKTLTSCYMFDLLFFYIVTNISMYT